MSTVGHCVGCDQPDRLRLDYRVTFADGTTDTVAYCNGCAELAQAGEAEAVSIRLADRHYCSCGGEIGGAFFFDAAGGIHHDAACASYEIEAWNRELRPWEDPIPLP